MEATDKAWEGRRKDESQQLSSRVLRSLQLVPGTMLLKGAFYFTPVQTLWFFSSSAYKKV